MLQILLITFILILVPITSKAQNLMFGGELAVSAELTSDYRFRGVSKSNNNIAVQGGLDWYADSGIYGGIFASSLIDFKTSDIEANFYAGYSSENKGIIYDFGVISYVYSDGKNASYFETFGSVGVDLGLLSSSVGISYMPNQNNLGKKDNFYFFNDTRGSIPGFPVNIDLHLGYEDGFFGNKKWDWSLGTSIIFEKFEVGVSYVDTNVVGKRSDSGIIFNVEAYF
ncbi:TorF family putative porin [Alphaproteobacteria bacterium]|nr:TorF family putative porin [Alphaproteobacteria bacterium]